MAQEPKELQLYQVRFNAQGSILHASVAVKGNTTGTADDAYELAIAVRDQVNQDTGMAYELIFINCIGAVYIWRNT